MDNVDIAGVLHLPVDTVKRVRTQLNNNDEAFGRAVQEYLEYKSGPFRDSKAGVDDWAESGKPRRAKKVRFSPAREPNQPQRGPLQGHLPAHALSLPCTLSCACWRGT